MHPEKLVDRETGRELDLLPFGEIAEDGKTVVWREDNSAWSVVGIQDALDHSLSLPLESGDAVSVLPMVTIPALVMLKIVAVHDRPEDRFKKDGTDIGFIIRHYLDVGNRGRLSGPDADVMDRTGDDLDLAAAMLVGRDIASICCEDTAEHVLELLGHETASGSRCHLVRGLRKTWRGDFARARDVIAHLTEGLRLPHH